MQDSQFLFVEASVDTCIKRIYEGAYRKKDRHFTTPEIIREHYSHDNFSSMREYQIIGQPVECIITDALTEGQFLGRVNHFVESSLLINQENGLPHIANEISLSKRRECL